jgi:hypothetical protein
VALDAHFDLVLLYLFTRCHFQKTCSAGSVAKTQKSTNLIFLNGSTKPFSITNCVPRSTIATEPFKLTIIENGEMRMSIDREEPAPEKEDLTLPEHLPLLQVRSGPNLDYIKEAMMYQVEHPSQCKTGETVIYSKDYAQKPGIAPVERILCDNGK